MHLLVDYSLSELVAVCEQHASSLGYSFEDGLHAQLEKLIADLHGDSIASQGTGNARLSISITDAAVRAHGKRASKQELVEAGDDGDRCMVLKGVDFGVGKRVGAEDDVKAQLDQEVMDLVGMDQAKLWLQVTHALLV